MNLLIQNCSTGRLNPVFRKLFRLFGILTGQREVKNGPGMLHTLLDQMSIVCTSTCHSYLPLYNQLFQSYSMVSPE